VASAFSHIAVVGGRRRTFVRGLGGPVDLDVEVPQVVFVGDRADAGDPAGCGHVQHGRQESLRFGHEALRFFYYPLWKSRHGGLVARSGGSVCWRAGRWVCKVEVAEGGGAEGRSRWLAALDSDAAY
jgi:hypothetical protein